MMIAFAKRLIFTILATTIMVFFSEKAYWYPQGYVIGILILLYSFPVYAVLWTIDYFRVRRLSTLLLAAALFAFLAEGAITPVIYEISLSDPIMPAYFIGWHGLLSFIFGWYYLRKWLVKGQWLRLSIGSMIFGLYWGIHSITFWLPENFEDFVNPGQWPIHEYALYALTFTVMLMFAHWLLGRGGWQSEFKPGRTERWALFAALTSLFALLVLPVAPLGIFKLAVLLMAVFFPLSINRRREGNNTVYTDLSGDVKIQHLLGMLLIPVMAICTYALLVYLQLSEKAIREMQELLSLSHSFVGAMVFVWAFLSTIRRSGRSEQMQNSFGVSPK